PHHLRRWGRLTADCELLRLGSSWSLNGETSPEPALPGKGDVFVRCGALRCRARGIGGLAASSEPGLRPPASWAGAFHRRIVDLADRLPAARARDDRVGAEGRARRLRTDDPVRALRAARRTRLRPRRPEAADARRRRRPGGRARE